MSAVDVLSKPEECGMLFVDFQAGADSVWVLRMREMIHPG
jgi:hypothetical protein